MFVLPSLGIVVSCVFGFDAAESSTVSDTVEALADEVTSLPGVEPPLASRQFSGFLDDGLGGRLHYWLVESEGDSSSDPVALWLNGGPGSSSLMGYLTELGPYIISADGGLFYNPFTWAKFANVIFLEAPAGVGFSYCDGNISAFCSADDDSTALGNVNALRDFFNRFPKFQGRPLMLWGESYAGVYVPTLAKAIVEFETKLPVDFLGFSVGNPCTSDKYQLNNPRGSFMDINPNYALSAGLIDVALHDELMQEQCRDRRAGEASACQVAWRTFDLLVSGLSGRATRMPGLGDGSGFLDGYDTGTYVGSLQPFWDATAAYLNRSDVRQALHVSSAPTWSLDAARLEYHKQYLACRDDPPDVVKADDRAAPQHKTSVLPIYRELAGAGYSLLVYSGDSDPNMQWVGSELCARSVDIAEGKSLHWRPWFYKEVPVPLELLGVKAPEWGPALSASPRRGDHATLGGYVENFVSKGTVTFATVRDAGHMVPQFRPQAALHLFAQTMSGALERRGSGPDLSPPLPASMFSKASAQEYYGSELKTGLLGKWLEAAQTYAQNTIPVALAKRSQAATSTGMQPSLLSVMWHSEHVPTRFAAAFLIMFVIIVVRAVRFQTWRGGSAYTAHLLGS
eukprot:TRINITY_DN20253_c0_g2_i1.p1 TRINITY_DN20253_c0_g2~~TRINITY_DN20253_c0_g2_i1.p1  ORF type:complete len:642 (-),score=61.89 TRINITY_DN20253_c0_g2_i1:59-1933(-)